MGKLVYITVHVYVLEQCLNVLVHFPQHCRENRYLLFLTENDAALEIMQNYLFQGDVKPYVLFGSSFPRDKDYTQVQHRDIISIVSLTISIC